MKQHTSEQVVKGEGVKSEKSSRVDSAKYNNSKGT